MRIDSFPPQLSVVLVWGIRIVMPSGACYRQSWWMQDWFNLLNILLFGLVNRHTYPPSSLLVKPQVVRDQLNSTALKRSIYKCLSQLGLREAPHHHKYNAEQRWYVNSEHDSFVLKLSLYICMHSMCLKLGRLTIRQQCCLGVISFSTRKCESVNALPNGSSAHQDYDGSDPDLTNVILKRIKFHFGDSYASQPSSQALLIDVWNSLCLI